MPSLQTWQKEFANFIWGGWYPQDPVWKAHYFAFRDACAREIVRRVPVTPRDVVRGGERG